MRLALKQLVDVMASSSFCPVNIYNESRDFKIMEV